MCISGLVHSLRPAWRPVLPICGGLLVHITLGAFYSIGNMNPYLASYLRIKGNDTEITYASMSFFVAFQLTGQGLCVLLGGIISSIVGPRKATILGCAILRNNCLPTERAIHSGVMLTFFAIRVSFWLTALTYSLLFGCGVGIAYTGPLVIAMQWLPGRKGLANGIIVAGFGLGAFMFNQIQTLYVNPNNQTPTFEDGQDRYFDDDEILDKLPSLFLVLSGAYTAMQICGCLLLIPPESSVSYIEKERTRSLNNGKGSEKLASTTEKSTLILNENEAKVSFSCQLDNRTEQTMQSYTPLLDMLKSPTFYIIWLGFFCLGQANAFMASFYKMYGQTFIADDSFLAFVGSFASVCNAASRILWGGLADRFTFKIATCVLSGVLTLLLLTMQAVHYGGQIMYFAWVCSIYLCVPGIFALYPAATATFFGQLHFGVNYGLVFTAQVATGLLSALLANGLFASIGYDGLFYVVAGFSLAALLITALLGFPKCLGGVFPRVYQRVSS